MGLYLFVGLFILFCDLNNLKLFLNYLLIGRVNLVIINIGLIIYGNVIEF